jgi:hypothetical protein
MNKWKAQSGITETLTNELGHDSLLMYCPGGEVLPRASSIQILPYRHKP